MPLDDSFEVIPNLAFTLLIAGAEREFEMAYDGTTRAAEAYGNKVVGPEAWVSKDGGHVLLAFRGESQTEFALLERDPELDPDPVPDYMSRYGDNLLDAVGVTRINFQKTVVGGDWTSGQAEGGISFAPEISFAWGIGYSPAFISSGGASLPGCITHGLDTPDDAEYLEFTGSGWDNFGQAAVLEQADFFGAAGTYVKTVRPKIRFSTSDTQTGVCVVWQTGSNDVYFAQTFFGDGDGSFHDQIGIPVDVFPAQLDGNAAQYTGVSFYRVGWGTLKVSEFELEMDSAS